MTSSLRAEQHLRPERCLSLFLVSWEWERVSWQLQWEDRCPRGQCD